MKTSIVRDLYSIIESHVWSPIIWKDGYRAKKNFTSARLLVLDFDDGNLTLEQAIEKFEPYIHIIGTTKSHQIEKAPKQYDVKTLNDTLYKYTHDKKGNSIKTSKADLFTLKKMANQSGYKLRKITLKEAKKKKLFGIDRLWPDQKEKSQWVLEDKAGEIVMQEHGRTNGQTTKTPEGEYNQSGGGGKFVQDVVADLSQSPHGS